ncbi:hypothetical protein SCB29_33575 [Paraburkholderia sp. SIMBA_055]
MAKTLQAINHGKKVEQVRIRVYGEYPHAQVVVIAVVDGAAVSESCTENICSEICSRLKGNVDDSQYVAYLGDEYKV